MKKLEDFDIYYNEELLEDIVDLITDDVYIQNEKVEVVVTISYINKEGKYKIITTRIDKLLFKKKQ